MFEQFLNSNSSTSNYENRKIQAEVIAMLQCAICGKKPWPATLNNFVVGGQTFSNHREEVVVELERKCSSYV